MKEEQRRKRGAISWVLEWAGRKKSMYVASVLLAVGNVFCRVVPYFLVAKIVSLLLNEVKDFKAYSGYIVMIAVSFVAAELLHSLSTSLSHVATFAVLAGIREACVNKLAKLPLGVIKDVGSGAYKNIMCERVDAMETTLAHVVPEFTSNLLVPIFVLGYLFTISWKLTLISFIPCVLGLLCSLGMFVGYEENFGRTVSTTKTVNSMLVEYVNGIEVIKVFGQTQSAYEKLKKAAMENAYSFINWMAKCIIPQTSFLVIMPYTLLTLLPFGAMFVSSGSLSLDDFIMCVILSLGVMGPITMVASYGDDMAQANVIIKEVTNVLLTPELIRPEVSKDMPKDNAIHLQDVRFAYKEQEVLHGINLDFAPGTINALVGPSGSGKSTIAKLVASLWDVDGGSITIGGVNIKDMSFEDYNRQVAYVSQDNYLFDMSVRENIRQGRMDASDEEVVEIAKRSGCYDFIMGLEDGFDTVVGGKGGHLSGGERQRISIARAMLKDAPIVILDEATAYTDPENEAIIQSSLAKLIRGKTVIVIAHRLSTIKDVDMICVIHDGNVEAQGKHEELLATSPLYKSMWEAHISVKDQLEEVAANV